MSFRRLWLEPEEGGLLDAWLVDTADVDARVPGVKVVALPLLMPNPAEAAALAAAALEVARAVR